MSAGRPPSAEPDGPPSYRAMMFGADGRMVLQAVIAAEGDDDAKAQALALVDGHSVDLWDQLRFIDRFEPDPAPAQVRTIRARSSDRAGMRLLPNEDL
ncbi:hypothetical protein AFCDBAGC_3927 [Methylobacterium cerastii]|uniref:DUF1488 family protein n=2 Tax=Methylobacterium TaxID=407 RepID=A0ABQ4QLF3_9HYPH|nr:MULTISPECIES: hypothetical protein [Methylobacterium]TXM93757.1 hypothetical protein FV222_22025 [Methylobacterium sp. WL103]TXN81868.1 hypothetical protein FV234_11785 [Methylobacterium sp. WL8]TXM68573.1 hypothetical protein FV229_07490 [Methylobacterium sp. WL120]TXM72336.1 hypothetical protein FV226_12435 [Methylobacterium sp. WL12]GJD46047.1 hypothetical protein AFCDBAGC_3927 [Methylobacterium cerastii]